MLDADRTFNSNMLDATELKIAIISSRFNNNITEKLTTGSIQGLLSLGIRKNNIGYFTIPGAFEFGVIVDKLAETKKYDAIICNGAIIRGDTAHFEYVANASTTSISNLAIKWQIPIIFGILTTENLQQAEERSQSGKENCGYKSALTAVEMVNLLKSIK